MNDETMNPKSKPKSDEMRSEYDFSQGVRGKYFQRYLQSSNVVVLEPDVASAFPNAEAVNDALRGLMRVCLFYTSDAADERSSVDLGGRRLIKKKKRRIS